MLIVPVHRGPPIDPDEVWTAWNWDPLIWLGLVAVAAIYHETWQRTAPHGQRAVRRRRAFLAGLAVVAIALLSPLDAVSASLASAHMVQHLLLTVVAAPLLAVGAPVPSVVGGLPRSVRQAIRRTRRSGPGRVGSRLVASPVAASIPAVVALWVWHGPVLYDAALEHHLLHGLEHVCLLATALLSWAAVFAAARRRGDRPGLAVLVLFGLSLSSGLLGLLLTFAPRPWYRSYTTTTDAWGLTPLADQQLAGVVMWIPTGGVYLVAALVILQQWIATPSAARPTRAAGGLRLEAHVAQKADVEGVHKR